MGGFYLILVVCSFDWCLRVICLLCWGLITDRFGLYGSFSLDGFGLGVVDFDFAGCFICG